MKVKFSIPVKSLRTPKAFQRWTSQDRKVYMLENPPYNAFLEKSSRLEMIIIRKKKMHSDVPSEAAIEFHRKENWIRGGGGGCVPSTTQPATTTEIPTTTELLVTTEEPTTSEPLTTTEIAATTELPVTTEEPATSEPPTATEIPATSEPPSTTASPTTNEPPPTTETPTTTESPEKTDSDRATVYHRHTNYGRTMHQI